MDYFTIDTFIEDLFTILYVPKFFFQRYVPAYAFLPTLTTLSTNTSHHINIINLEGCRIYSCCESLWIYSPMKSFILFSIKWVLPDEVNRTGMALGGKSLVLVTWLLHHLFVTVTLFIPSPTQPTPFADCSSDSCDSCYFRVMGCTEIGELLLIQWFTPMSGVMWLTWLCVFWVHNHSEQ